MRTETEYLRAELIAARGLLADCVGLFNAIEVIEPNCAASVRANLQERIAEFQTHGIAVLPEGVRANG